VNPPRLVIDDDNVVVAIALDISEEGELCGTVGDPGWLTESVLIFAAIAT
jgi:hypothetical protein